MSPSLTQPVYQLDLLNLSGVVCWLAFNRLMLPLSYSVMCAFRPSCYFPEIFSTVPASAAVPNFCSRLAPTHYSTAPPALIPAHLSGFTSAWIFYASLMSGPRCKVDKRSRNKPTGWWRAEVYSNFQPKGKGVVTEATELLLTLFIFLWNVKRNNREKYINYEPAAVTLSVQSHRAQAWKTGRGITPYWIS